MTKELRPKARVAKGFRDISADEIRGTGADGRSVDLSGTGTDVVRRDADGLWRYAVDNPFGGLKPSA